MVKHYAIVCNQKPLNDKTIVFAVITSAKSDYLLTNVKRQYGKNFIQLVSPVVFRRLDRLSYINCHLPVLRTLEQLQREVDSEEAVFYHPGTDKFQLINICVSRMLESDKLSDAQKNIIRSCC